MTEQTTAVELYSESFGNGPSLVILHGLFGSKENWRSQAKLLANRYTVHCLDARNHGDSPHRATMSYREMAADVAHTCERLKIEQFNLLGHSMGGKTAMQLALLKPELLNKLIVVDIGPRQYPHHHTTILNGLDAVQNATINSRSDADQILSNYEENKFIRAFLLKNLNRTDDNTFELKINLNAIQKHYNSIAAAVEADTAQATFEGPTLFIKGAESDYLTTNDRDMILGMFPHTTLKVIDGAGHWPHSEKPQVVNKIISDFLD